MGQVSQEIIDQEEKSSFLNSPNKKITEKSQFSLVSEPSNNNEIKIEVKPEVVETETKRQRGWRKFTGLLLALLASFFFSLVALFAKTLQLRGYHAFSLSAWRQLGNAIPSIPLIIYYQYGKNKNIFDHVWPLNTKENKSNLIGMGIRAFLSASAILLGLWSLKYLTIADSTVVNYSGPIFIIVLSHFFLKEKSGVTAISIGVWTLLGVVLIGRPSFLTGKDMDVNILIGTAIAFFGVLCQSASTILLRKIRKVHFALLTFLFGVWGFFQSLILSIAFDVFSFPANYTDIGLTAVMSLISFFAQMCAIMALKFEQAGVVSLVATSHVIWAFMWQIIIMDVLPDLCGILGASVVMIGILITAARKWISTLPKENRTRKIFGFLLK